MIPDGNHAVNQLQRVEVLLASVMPPSAVCPASTTSGYRAVQPPSMERQAPVMAAASSVHRCRTRAPT